VAGRFKATPDGSVAGMVFKDIILLRFVNQAFENHILKEEQVPVQVAALRADYHPSLCQVLLPQFFPGGGF
jgi:hypothetical protein